MIEVNYRLLEMLENYPDGLPSNKPDVLEQIETLKKQRQEIINQNKNKGTICVNNNGKEIQLNNEQIVEILQNQHIEIQRLKKELSIKNKLLDTLTNKKNELI